MNLADAGRDDELELSLGLARPGEDQPLGRTACGAGLLELAGRGDLETAVGLKKVSEDSDVRVRLDGVEDLEATWKRAS